MTAGKWEETDKWILENGTKNKLEIIGINHQYPPEPGSLENSGSAHEKGKEKVTLVLEA